MFNTVNSQAYFPTVSSMILQSVNQVLSDHVIYYTWCHGTQACIKLCQASIRGFVRNVDTLIVFKDRLLSVVAQFLLNDIHFTITVTLAPSNLLGI